MPESIPMACFDRRSINISNCHVTAASVFEIQTSKASIIVGALVALAGVLGILILAFDKILRESVPAHFYALIVFVLIDFIIAAVVLAKPSRMAFTVAAGWSLLRVILQIADVSQAHQPGIEMRYRDFADYLFNPLSSIATSAGNPPGIPGALIDLIMIFEIIVLVVAWRARSASKN